MKCAGPAHIIHKPYELQSPRNSMRIAFTASCVCDVPDWYSRITHFSSTGPRTEASGSCCSRDFSVFSDEVGDKLCSLQVPALFSPDVEQSVTFFLIL